MSDQPVELLRVETSERLYDREAVLGRDAASVFASLRTPQLDLGTNAPRFVTEAQLSEMKLARGGACVEDGTASADKPLHEVLRENKEKKVRQPLDALHFLTDTTVAGVGVPRKVEDNEAGSKQASRRG